MSEVHTFAGGPLDRAGHRRTDADWIAAKLKDQSTRIVPLWKLQPLVTPRRDGIGWLSPADVDGYLMSGVPTIFIGEDDAGVAHFAIDVTSFDDANRSEPFTNVGKFMDLRAIALQLPMGDPSTLGTAKAILDWNARHQFCAVCGNATEMRECGYMRKCSNGECNAEHFPRTDPVVIMLPVRGDDCLIGRQPMFPANMYSALAGFIEPGENIEEAVRREVMEEAGITVSDVRYHSTQPWPSSLMIGCFADAETTEITVDGLELEEARWVSRTLLKDVMNGATDTGVLLPPPMAIGFQLIRAFTEMK
ncbi:MAG: NAD(+) diphosphatase [Porticoccaceae bacterium]|nr:NAD(+) diphosphatase [Porticoccaceae bacterium]